MPAYCSVCEWRDRHPNWQSLGEADPDPNLYSSWWTDYSTGVKWVNICRECVLEREVERATEEFLQKIHAAYARREARGRGIIVPCSRAITEYRCGRRRYLWRGGSQLPSEPTGGQ